MAHADAQALATVLPLLRQLRDMKGLTEKGPGIFYCKGSAFVHFHVQDGAVVADLKTTRGTGFDRYPLDTPPAQRKLLDDARRLARQDED